MNVCPECRFCIGSFSLIIEHFIETSKKSSKKICSEKAVMSNSVNYTLEEYFNLLRIDNMCCRMHLTAAWKPPFDTPTFKFDSGKS